MSLLRDRRRRKAGEILNNLIGLDGYRSFLGSRGRGFEHCKVSGFASGKLLLAPPTRHISQEAFGLSVASAGTEGEAELGYRRPLSQKLFVSPPAWGRGGGKGTGVCQSLERRVPRDT